MKISFVVLKRLISKVVNKALLFFWLLSLFTATASFAGQDDQNISKKYSFDIPSQPLINSLNTLSDISKISFLFPYDLVEDKRGNKVKGFYTVQESLNIMLEGSNLEGELSNNKAFLIKPISQNTDINNLAVAENSTNESILDSIFSLLFGSSNDEEIAPNNDTKESVEEMEVIEITGIKGSFDNSVAIKRYADTVIDEITTEDIGQFSDNSIAGAIKRIPGVQIETDDAGTDGDRVSIRGLGPEFVNSTINGRRLLSSGNEAKSMRKMNFNVFPPNILSGVTVIKGQTASGPESGIAGSVNLKSLRVLDIDKLDYQRSYSAVAARIDHNDIDNNTGERFSLLAAMRNEDSSLGGYISLVVGEEQNARDQLHFRLAEQAFDLKIDEDGDGIQDSTIDAVLVPNTIVMSPIREETERLAFASGVEFRPNNELDINWDLLYSKYENNSHRDQSQPIIGGTWSNTIFDMSDSDNPALIVDSSNSLLKYADFSRSNDGGEIRNQVASMRFDNETENLITGINVNWLINSRLNANFDAYISTVDYSQDLRFPTMRKILDKSQFIYDGRGRLPKLTATDIEEEQGYNYLFTVIREVELKGDNFGFTAKFDYLLDIDNVISSVEYGAHFDSTELDVLRSNNGRITGFGGEIIDAAVTGKTNSEDFFADDNYKPARWAALNYNAAVGVDPRINDYGMDELGINRLDSYQVTENIFSLFGQINLNMELGDMPVTGNFGVRTVLTENESNAGQNVNGEISPINEESEYWELLPSLNLNFAINDDLALRFGVAKVLSRPDYQQLAPINTIDEISGVAILGNPELNAMTSINYDVTLQWYNSYDSAFVLSTFYKDVSDLIFATTQSDLMLPGYEGSFDVISYQNYSDGNAKGFEVSLYQPFEKIFPNFSGFGFSSNYTFVDSEFDKNVGDNNLGFPGASKDNFNFIAFYENDYIGVRLAYIYRSEFLRSVAGVGSQTNSERVTGEQEKLDLSINIKPTKSFSLRFTANNLTDDKRRDMQENNVLLATWDRGRTYSLEATYAF